MLVGCRNRVLYYAPTIFNQLGLKENTTSLLATGVVGVVMFLFTIPAVLWVVSCPQKKAHIHTPCLPPPPLFPPNQKPILIY